MGLREAKECPMRNKETADTSRSRNSRLKGYKIQHEGKSSYENTVLRSGKEQY